MIEYFINSIENFSIQDYLQNPQYEFQKDFFYCTLMNCMHAD